MDNNLCLKWNEHGGFFKGELKKYRFNNEWSDCILVGGDGEEFKVHKLVLGMGSGFLRGVLLEEGVGGTPRIILPEVGSQEINLLLDFLYNGVVYVEGGMLRDFFDLAKNLEVKGLLLGEFNNFNCNNNKRDYSSEEDIPSTSLKIRATDPRPCPKCGKIYRSAHTLRTHLEDKHTSCPGYRCVLCGTVAKSRNSLHSHMSRQHRGISTKDLPVLAMPSPFDPDLAARLLNRNSAILDSYMAFINRV